MSVPATVDSRLLAEPIHVLLPRGRTGSWQGTAESSPGGDQQYIKVEGEQGYI